MSEAPEVLKPLRTYSHLAEQRRRPSEYEIVSTNLHYHMNNPKVPWELDPNHAFNVWFRKYRNDSPLKHDDWDAFRDPDEIIYRSYNIMQDGQETYVDGLLDEFNELEHDSGLSDEWVGTLARLYTPGRYLIHTLQMTSAYLACMAPASTITNCASFQSADSLRWLSRIAYRTAELARHHPGKDLGENERRLWEKDPSWQGFRELMEKTLVAYDWGESFVAGNLVAKVAVDEAFLRQLCTSARRNGDTLLGFLVDAQLRDSDRSRRWTSALVRLALEKKGNQEVIGKWLKRWVPLGNAAIDAYCAALPDAPTAAKDARQQARAFRSGLGFDV